MRELDVGYVLVIFGGLTGYSSDGNNNSSSFESILNCSLMFIKHGIECCGLKDWMLKWEVYAVPFLHLQRSVLSYCTKSLYTPKQSFMIGKHHSFSTLIAHRPTMCEYTVFIVDMYYVLTLHVNACRYKQVPMDGTYRRFDTRGRSHKGA